MKKNSLFIILLAAIIIIVVGYWMVQETPEKKTVKPVSQPNVVSQAEKKANSSVAHNNKRRKKENHKKTEKEQAWLSFLAGREVSSMNTKPTYLEAYRDYVYYGGCIALINNILNDQDPYFYVIGKNQSFDDLPVAQQKALNGRLNKCLVLTDFSDKTYHPQYALGQLMQRYKSIQPKTDHEQQLAATLKLISDLNFSHNRLSSEQSGEVIDPQLQVDLITMRRQLKDQMPKPLSFFGGYNEADQILVDQLRRQIADIDQQILDNKHVDNEQIIGFKTEIKRLVSELQRVVIDTRSSDAYLAVYDFIEEVSLLLSNVTN